MSTSAIIVDGLSKRYRLGTAPRANALRDVLASGLKALWPGHSAPPRRTSDTLWALKDISFEVKQGEVVGLIGRNGSGKSTLLRILAKITRPTSGTAEVRGRLGSLLEVGTGFHGELTGQENVYLSGAILGMKKHEIRRRFDDIVAFSGVERFLDTPVKHYSSGMYVRLAFAVAAYMEPEILLVDEVLAVGDLEFQRKCLGKMHDVAGSGRTVLFVSHDIGAINALCSRAILLHQGQIVKEGVAKDVVDYYVDANNRLYSPISYPVDDRGELRLRAICATQNGRLTSVVDCREPFDLTLDYDVASPLKGSRFGLHLRNHRGETVFTTSDSDTTMTRADIRTPGSYRSTVSIPGKLFKVGRLYATFSADIPAERVVFAAVDALELDVVDLEPDDFAERNGRPGVIAPILDWSHQLLATPEVPPT
jgi:lipopolysaccharide transport system ATP-binding protein